MYGVYLGGSILQRLPAYLCFLTQFKHSTYNIRSQDTLTSAVPLITTELGKTGFKYFAAYKWNELQKTLNKTQQKNKELWCNIL